MATDKPPPKTETPASTAPAADGTISLDVCAKLLMLSPQRINQLERGGFITKAGRGRYRIADAVQGYIRYLKDEGRQASKSASQSRVSDARARDLELRIMERNGSMIAAAEERALAIADEFAGPLRSDLMALPARATTDIGLRQKLADGIDAAFAAATKRAADIATRLGKTGAAERRPEKAKPRRVGARKSRVPAKRRSAGAA